MDLFPLRNRVANLKLVVLTFSYILRYFITPCPPTKRPIWLYWCLVFRIRFILFKPHPMLRWKDKCALNILLLCGLGMKSSYFAKSIWFPSLDRTLSVDESQSLELQLWVNAVFGCWTRSRTKRGIIDPLVSKRRKQARKPRSYASPKLCRLTHLLTDRGNM